MAATHLTTPKREADERAELLARALADFPTFCRSICWIAPKDGKRTTLRFNPIQAKYERARTWRDIVLKPRQIGFTTLELARDVYRFITQPGERSIIVCQTVADASPPWKKVSADVQRMFGGLKQAGLQLDFGTESESMWTLPGRDASLQIIEAGASEAAAAKKARGGTFSRLHITEAAFYEHAELSTNSMFEGVPSLPNTSIVIESTPNGVGNWYHSQWVAAVAGANGFAPHFFGWYEDPSYAIALSPGEEVEPQTDRERELVEVRGISPEQLKWYRTKVSQKGQDLVDQEFASDANRTFLTSGRLFFDLAQLEKMGGRMREPIERRDGPAQTRIWRRASPGSRYVVSVDPAEGLGEDGDWTYATVWDRRTHEHVASLRTQLRENMAAEAVDKLAGEYNDAEIVVERNKGLAIIGALERITREPGDDRRRPRVFYDDDGKPGIFTSVTSRPAMLSDLASAVRDGSLTTNDPILLAEMRAFVIDGRNGRPFAPGKHRKHGVGDDGILSCAIGWALLLRPETKAKPRVGGQRSPVGDW